VVDFLLSDSAGFISGVALRVDGSYRCGQKPQRSDLAGADIESLVAS